MRQSVVIEHFRGFRRLELPRLERVNLIAGKNNTGKTSLLEALCCLGFAVDSSVVAHLNAGRGLSAKASCGEETCRWLYFDQDVSRPIRLTETHSGGEAVTEIRLVTAENRAAFSPTFEQLQRTFLGPNGFDKSHLPYLLSVLSTNGVPGGYSVVEIRELELAPTFFSIHGRPKCFFLGFQGPLLTNANKLFSQVEAAKRQDEILVDLQLLEPRLQRLTLLYDAGEISIHGDVGLSRLVPVNFLGEGLRRLLSILLAIACAPGGTVLIDEVEAGFHHSVMPQVWGAIAAAAERQDVQVFATTHSYECIGAAHAAFAARPQQDLMLHRLERERDESRAIPLTTEMIGTATEFSLEIR